MKLIALLVVIAVVIAGGFILLSSAGLVDLGEKVTLTLDNSRTQGTATFTVTYTQASGEVNSLTKVVPYSENGGICVVTLPSDTTAISVSGSLGGNIRTAGAAELSPGDSVIIWYTEGQQLATTIGGN